MTPGSFSSGRDLFWESWGSDQISDPTATLLEVTVMIDFDSSFVFLEDVRLGGGTCYTVRSVRIESLSL